MTDRQLASRLIRPDFTAPAPFGSLTTAIHHASTVTFANVAAMRNRSPLDETGYSYGLHATPTTYELQHRIALLEGGRYALLAPSGLSAIALINLALLEAGDEVLMPYNAYGPNREMSQHMLSRYGIVCRGYDPMDLDRTAALISAQTRLMWIEAPGSVSMEVCDIKALAQMARAQGVLTALDNTWSSGIFLCAFDCGVDIAMQALTKYPSGGSDVLMGSVVTRDERLHQRLKLAHQRLGLGVSGDDAYLVLRGLPSLVTRLRQHEASAYQVAAWCALRPEIDRVLHPGLASCPGHAFWSRDFSGASGLFSVTFQPHIEQSKVDALVDRLALFSIGFSWGGSQSLAVPYQMQALRPDGGWAHGALLRLFIGLEAPDDLIADLSQAFEVLTQ